MKKLLMIAALAMMPAVATYAHCGKCGPDHKHGTEKKCCGKDGKCCKEKKSCCGKDGKCCKKSDCKKSDCKKGDCKKSECKKDCTKKCCSKGEAASAGKVQLQYAVKGMTCGGCEGKLTRALTSVDGVTVDKVCSKGGVAKVTIDESKVSAADVEKAIASTGFTVTQ